MFGKSAAKIWTILSGSKATPPEFSPECGYVLILQKDIIFLIRLFWLVPRAPYPYSSQQPRGVCSPQVLLAPVILLNSWLGKRVRDKPYSQTQVLYFLWRTVQSLIILHYLYTLWSESTYIRCLNDDLWLAPLSNRTGKVIPDCCLYSI